MNTQDLPSILKVVEFVEGVVAFNAFPVEGSGGVLVIGFDTTCYPNGRAVEAEDQPISRTYAESLLVVRLTTAAHALWSYLKREPSPNQWAALVSLADSVGAEMIGTSQLVRLMNAGAADQAAGEFSKFTHRFVDGALIPDATFEKRRESERDLFVGGST